MKNNSSKAIREGAMMIALTAVLVLLAWYVPLFSFAGMFVCGVPMACMSARNPGKYTVVAAVGAFLITFLITMNLPAAVSLMLMTILPGVIVGWCLGKGVNFYTTLFATCLTVCLGWVLEFYTVKLMTQGNGIETMMNDMLGQMDAVFKAYIAELPEEMLRKTDLAAMFSAALEQMKSILSLYMPAIVVISSMITGYAILMICGFFIRRLRLANIQLVPFSMLKAPRGMCFLAVVLYLISMFVEKESAFRAASANVILVLYLIIGICGLSFIDYLFSKAVRVGILRALIYFATFMMSGALFGIIGTMLVLAGLIDSSHNFRRITSDEEPFDENGGDWV